MCERADADDDVRVVVLRGAGGKAFVAGHRHLASSWRSPPARTGVRYEADIDRVVGRLEAVRKPTIALVDGFAMGSGLVLAAGCDLRICTPDARFGMPIARTVGNCLSMANYARLAALIGEARVKQTIFHGARHRGREALAIGLATRSWTTPRRASSSCASCWPAMPP